MYSVWVFVRSPLNIFELPDYLEVLNFFGISQEHRIAERRPWSVDFLDLHWLSNGLVVQKCWVVPKQIPKRKSFEKLCELCKNYLQSTKECGERLSWSFEHFWYFPGAEVLAERRWRSLDFLDFHRLPVGLVVRDRWVVARPAPKAQTYTKTTRLVPIWGPNGIRARRTINAKFGNFEYFWYLTGAASGSDGTWSGMDLGILSAQRQKEWISELRWSCGDLCSINDSEKIYRKGFRAFERVVEVSDCHFQACSFFFVDMKHRRCPPSEIVWTVFDS